MEKTDASRERRRGAEGGPVERHGSDEEVDAGAAEDLAARGDDVGLAAVVQRVARNQEVHKEEGVGGQVGAQRAQVEHVPRKEADANGNHEVVVDSDRLNRPQPA